MVDSKGPSLVRPHARSLPPSLILLPRRPLSAAKSPRPGSRGQGSRGGTFLEGGGRGHLGLGGVTVAHITPAVVTNHGIRKIRIVIIVNFVEVFDFRARLSVTFLPSSIVCSNKRLEIPTHLLTKTGLDDFNNYKSSTMI